jgi:hypothetical protein
MIAIMLRYDRLGNLSLVTLACVGLGTGRWSCRGRGVANAGGRWSESVPVTVRAR